MPYRLSGFDYTRPFFYMVTLKRRPGLLPLSEIVAPGRCQMLPVTRALLESIRTFHLQWPCVEPIECFTIMPDHVHLLINIRPVEGRLSLPRIVWLLIRRLEAAAVACGAAGASPSQTPNGLPGKSLAPGRSASLLFERDWHDWIVMKPGQLAAFTRYIRDNPARPTLHRRCHEMGDLLLSALAPQAAAS